MKQARTLRELFSFDGFIPKDQLEGKFGDPLVRIIDLERKKKQQDVLDVILFIITFMIEKFVWHETVTQKVIGYISVLKDEEWIVINAIGFVWKP
jgi:accessory gene regulator protein AgrB